MKRALLLTAVSAAVALGAPAGAEQAASKPDLAKAQQIVNQSCFACHGADGNSPTPANPNLAGPQADYVALPPAHFKNGIRHHPGLARVAAGLTPEAMRSPGGGVLARTSSGVSG